MSDLVKIAETAARECIRQQVGIDRLALLLAGWNRLMHYSGPIESEVLLTIAGLVEPGNRGQLRRTPVTFANGGSSAAPDTVARLWRLLIENQPIGCSEIGVRSWLRDLLWVHPFTDGNGRLAWLLFNYYGGDMTTAVALPDFGW